MSVCFLISVSILIRIKSNIVSYSLMELQVGLKLVVLEQMSVFVPLLSGNISANLLTFMQMFIANA